MSSRALAAAASAAAVAFAGAGCGASPHHDALVWVQAPQVFKPRDLPRDRIVIGRIRNASNATLRLVAASLRVRDSRGQVLKSSAGFTASYAHGLFGAFQQPSPEPLRELVRLGRVVFLNPGATSPVFAAWRLPSNAHEPVSIDYGKGTLAVPTAAARPTAP